MRNVTKSFAIAATFFASMLLAGGGPALAKVKIYIGVGDFSWIGPGYYGGKYREFLSCGEGRWIVSNRGYNGVRPIDCSPRFYRYEARRKGKFWRLRLDARTGEIVGRTRI